MQMGALFQLSLCGELGGFQPTVTHDLFDTLQQRCHWSNVVREYDVTQLAHLRTLVRECTLVHVDTLGSRLNAVRTLAELSQAELARLAGLKSTRHIGLIEEDERANPTLETTKGLCRAVGMSLDWFLLGKGEAPTLEQVRQAVAAARAAFDGGGDSAPAAG